MARGNPSKLRALAVALFVGLGFWAIVAVIAVAGDPGETASIIGGSGALVPLVVWLAYSVIKEIKKTPEQPEIPRGLPASARSAVEQGLYWQEHSQERARYLAAHPQARRRNRLTGLWVAVAGLLGFLVWITVIAAAIHQTPGVDGWLNGIFGGLFAGLLTMLIVLLPGFVMAPFLALPGDAAASPQDTPHEPDAELDQTLAELEAVRQQARGQVPAPRPVLAPIGAVAGLLGFIVFGGAFSVLGLLLSLAFGAVAGALAGYGPAAGVFFRLDAIYGKLYLQRVVPKLLAGFGQLAWRRPAQPPLEEFRRYRLFPPWNSVLAGDEIHGGYRGLPLSISELGLSASGNGGFRFEGLAVTLTLPRGLQGTTVVTPSQSVFAHFAERWREGAQPPALLQPVHLEDPKFAQAFEVNATDQISSRALLTPAFMERFKALAQRLGAPALLMQDSRLIIALATGNRDFFQPPSFREPATARARLTRLRDDIATLLRVADAVIDLDQGARQMAAQTM